MNFYYKYLKQVGILELQTINIVPVIGKQYRIKNLVSVKPKVVLKYQLDFFYLCLQALATKDMYYYKLHQISKITLAHKEIDINRYYLF